MFLRIAIVCICGYLGGRLAARNRVFPAVGVILGILFGLLPPVISIPILLTMVALAGLSRRETEASMERFNCPECGREVAATAWVCPRCGHHFRSRQLAP